jgi:hypothetical protein
MSDVVLSVSEEDISDMSDVVLSVSEEDILL